MKIGVFGSAGKVNSGLLNRAGQVGRALGNRNVIVITGACSGLPYAAAEEASKVGSVVWGFSPVANEKQQKEFTPNDDLSIYDKIYYVPASISAGSVSLIRPNQLEDFRGVLRPAGLAFFKKYRNVLSTSACDAGIIIHGGWGTLNEFTNLVDMGKVVGILTGGGGIVDALESLIEKIGKKTKAQVIFSDDPEKLVEKVIAECGKL